MSIITEYFDYIKEYTEKYGENTAVLIQVGSFFELYSVNNKKEKIGNAEEIAQLLNIHLTRKNKKILEINRKNPYMAGIPVPVLEKYLPILLDNNYTVVLVEQTTAAPKPERKVTNIYSPGTIISKDTYTSYITVLYIETMKSSVIVGLACIDLSSGKIILHEFYSDFNEVLSKVYTFLHSFIPKEIIIHIKSKEDFLEYNKIVNYLELNDTLVHYHNNTNNDNYTTYIKPNYQNEFLSKIYTNNTLLSTIEYLDLDNKMNSTLAFILLLNFIYTHNENMLNNLQKPEHYNENKYLIYTDNLDIFTTKRNGKGKFKCVFDVINKTITAIGKRQLKDRILFPLIDISTLNERYNEIDKIGKMNNNKVILLDKTLSEILDIEKLHRKMAIGTLHPCDFMTLHTAYLAVIRLQSNFEEFPLSCISDFEKYINEYTNSFDLDEISKYNLDDIQNSFFKKGVYNNLDDLQSTLTIHTEKLEDLAKELSQLIHPTDLLIKVSSTDKDGYYLTTTNVRANLLKKNLTEKQKDLYSFIVNKSGVKILSKDIQTISENLLEIQNQVKAVVKETYIKVIKELCNKYTDTLNNVIYYIGNIDIALSSYRTSKEYCYTRPRLVENEQSSFVDIKGLRHPLVERINDTTKYIDNDIQITGEGIVLYGLNFAGKSTLIKSLGLSVILAQAGLYVPCKELVLSPYSTVITRLQGNDNILKGQSSFVVEMLELMNILKNANVNALIIMDELCRGTETESANAIVTASLLELASKNTSFILATHLRFIAEYPEIKDNKKIKIKSLSVNFKDTTVIFDRKLKDGLCAELYGIEVCKFLGLNPAFIHKALSIRDTITNRKKEILSTKKSKYNTKKIVDACEICKYYPNKKTDLPLDVHHIQFQCNADESGMIHSSKDESGGIRFHKNELHNLVVLCKGCHQEVHQNKIRIEGYITTAEGPILEFKKIN